jgi:hypothetical protein
VRFGDGPVMHDRARKPIDTTSYLQSPASFLTLETICCAVIVGPDSISRLSCSLLARILTWVPPTSMTRIFMGRSIFSIAF